MLLFQNLLSRPFQGRRTRSGSGEKSPNRKRFKVETDKMETENGHGDAEPKSAEAEEKPAVTPAEQKPAVPLCPAQEVTGYSVTLLPQFCADRLFQKQLLVTWACRAHSRLGDMFFSRTKIRARVLQEQDVQNHFEDPDLYCGFETQVTEEALDAVKSQRPYRVVEEQPVLQFHTHVTLVNQTQEFLSLEVVLESDEPPEKPVKNRKKGAFVKDAFGERHVTCVKAMLAKMCRHFPV